MLTPQLYPLSLHDALPILAPAGLLMRSTNGPGFSGSPAITAAFTPGPPSGKFSHLIALGAIITCGGTADRKSTRLNSSHVAISYAVFCLKKKTHEDGPNTI